MAEKVKFIIEVDDQGGAKVVDNFNKKVKDTGETVENSQSKMGELGQALGNIKGPVGQAIQGVQGLSASLMKLVMNPVGAVITAIVLSLTALYKAFTSTKAGGEQMEQVMDAIGAALDVVRDRVLKVGSAIVKFFSGDFEGAFADAKGAVSGLTDEIAREAKEAANLRKELQKITDEERELSKVRAEQNKKIAEARLILDDQNASYADRKKALDIVTNAEKTLALEEEKLIKRKYEAIKAQNALSDSSKEALDAEAAAYVELQNAQKTTAAVQRKLQMEAIALQREQAAKDKEAADKRKQYAQERLSVQDKIRQAEQKNLIDSTQDEFDKAMLSAQFAKEQSELEIKRSNYTAKEKAKLQEEIEKSYQLQIAKIKEDAAKKESERIKKQAEDDKAFLEKAAAEEQKFIDDEFKKQELIATQTIKNEELLNKKLEELELQRLENQIQARKDAGLSTTELELQLSKKRIEIANNETKTKQNLDKQEFDAKMELLSATSGALKSFASLAGEQTAAGKVLALASTVIDTYMGATKALAAGAGTPVGYINAAAIIATGLANVRTITAVQVPNEGGGSNISTPALNAAPSVGIVSGQMNQTNQLQAQLNSQMSRPTRAYVVGQNVTSQQSLDRHIAQNATL
jgi:hypothetical protein